MDTSIIRNDGATGSRNRRAMYLFSVMKKTKILQEMHPLRRGAFVDLDGPLKSSNAKVIRAGRKVSPIDLGP